MTQLWNKGPWFLWEMVAVVTPEAVKYVSVYAAFEALLMVFMPGKTFVGPTTAGGNRPVYKVRNTASDGCWHPHSFSPRWWLS